MTKNKKGEKIVLIGSGPTVTKTITCAEIIKRKTKVKIDIGSMMLLYMDVLVHLQRTCSPALLLQSYGLK